MSLQAKIDLILLSKSRNAPLCAHESDCGTLRCGFCLTAVGDDNSVKFGLIVAAFLTLRNFSFGQSRPVIILLLLAESDEPNELVNE